MDTLEFLQKILPEHGIHYLALFKEGYKFPAHKVYTDLETMAEAINSMANSNSLSVYHACASYQKAVIEIDGDDGKVKRKYRIQSNWDRAKAFWVDIDCGEAKHAKGEGYLTKRDACQAVFKFADTIGWPRPMIVDSGNGMHAYWPLTKDIAHDKWVKVAKGFKATLHHCGVIADPTRTADFASILRPPGSVNRKNGDAKPVVVKAPGTVSDPAELALALNKYMVEHGVKVLREAPAKQYVNDLNSDLTAHLPQYPDLPVDANAVADKCQQVAVMRDTKGDLGYEPWRGVIGILTHCENGRKIAEDWSSNREETGHTSIDWDIKYDTWGAGPTTCEFFQGCNPTGCDGCAMKGKIKTPLVLGRQMPENEATVEEVVTEEGTTVEAEIPALLSGYTYSNGVMARLVPDKEGVLQPHPFSSIMFYPTSRIRTQEGTYRIGMRMHLPHHKVRDFDMPTEALASNTDMLRSLAKYELLQSNHKDAGNHMAAYLRDQLQELKRTVEEVNTLTTFGWRDDMSGFLIGDRLYHKDGTVRKVLIGGYAAAYKSALPEPRGSMERYASALNYMYNRAGSEHWQYAICSGWGSVLSPFGEDTYRGLLVALSGGDTGKGKTTACFSSLYAFGNANDMALKSEKGSTENAMWSTLGAFNNLPILVDELTSMEPAKFSDMAYGVSRGEDKKRMASRGGSVGFAEKNVWCMSPFVTGNKDFHGLLAANQANSQAEAVRLIQIQVDRYPIIKIDEDEQVEAQLVQQAVDAMKANQGSAGDVMLRHIVTHQRQIADEVRSMMNELTKHLPTPRYRFYRNHGACTLTAARIAKDLGIVDFDMDALFEFTVQLLTDLAETVTETNTVTTEDAFSRMMADLQPRILVTTEYRDKRSKSGAETPRSRPANAATIAGRYVMGSPNEKQHAGHLMVCQAAAREWCMKNRVDYNNMLGDLEDKKALVKKHDKVLLTRGTDLSPVQSRVFIVDYNKLDANSLTVVSSNSDQELAQAMMEGV